MKTKTFFISLAVGVAALASAYGFGKNAKIDVSKLPASARAAVVQEHKTLNAEFANIFNQIDKGNIEEAKAALRNAYALADTLKQADTKYQLLEAQLKVMETMLSDVGSVYSMLLTTSYSDNLTRYQKEGDIHIILYNTVIQTLREMYRFGADSEVAKQTPEFRKAIINMIKLLCDERLEQMIGWRTQLEALIRQHPGAKGLPNDLDFINQQIRALEGIKANLRAGLPI